MNIKFEQSNEYLTTHAGLTIIGALLSRTQLRQRVGQTVLPEIKTFPDISNGDVLTSYVGLLCQGKSDFDHIEPFRKDDAFSLSLQIHDAPSSPTLRQRLDMAGKLEGDSDWKNILLEESADLLKQMQVELTPVHITLPGGKEQEFRNPANE
jgi:hypothetical protein